MGNYSQIRPVEAASPINWHGFRLIITSLQPCDLMKFCICVMQRDFYSFPNILSIHMFHRAKFFVFLRFYILMCSACPSQYSNLIKRIKFADSEVPCRLPSGNYSFPDRVDSSYDWFSTRVIVSCWRSCAALWKSAHT